jgi:hypothetical protein
VEDVVNRKSFGIADLPMKRDLVGETITRGLELALGMPEAKAAPPLVPTRPAAAAPVASTGMPAAKAHPADGFKDVYAYAASLSPKAFKAFVDKNADNANLKGMGYVEMDGKIIPTISRPDEQGQGIGRDLTVGELEAMSPLVREQMASRDRQAAIRWDVEKFAKANDMKDPQNVLKLAASIAPRQKTTTYDDQGNATVNEVPDVNAGLKMLRDMGFKGLPEIQPRAGMGTATKPPVKGDIKTLTSGRTATFDGTRWVLK